MSTSYSIQHTVAREAGKPFREVVQWYAEQGHSQAETALMLGYRSTSAFNRLCRKHGWADWFRPKGQTLGDERAREARRGLVTPALLAALQKAQEARGVRRHEFDGITDSLAGHARRLGLPERRVYRRWEQTGDLDFALSGKIERPASKPSQSHPWRCA